MHDPYLTTEIAKEIWRAKYRFQSVTQRSDTAITDTWWRVARGAAGVENDVDRWAQRFYQALEGFRFLPGGRILAGAGTDLNVTLFNCFVMGRVADSMDGIFDALKEAAITMQQGGGVGVDFSTLRPNGARARATGTIASGPVSFMRIWDAMCGTILSTGSRRGAMMGVLRCDHPDIEEFVDAKRERGRLRHFNISVAVTDAFMQAVREDKAWRLAFPEETDDEGVVKSVSARELWRKIIKNAYDCAEPGVLFIDRINQSNNLAYCEAIAATNPCGELPLPPYGACDLGSINLTACVKEPFSAQASFDLAGLDELVAVAVRFLDNVIDVSRFPLAHQAEQARATRRIGVGITGLADALLMLGLHYADSAARDMATTFVRRIRDSAYRASVELAREKGAFPLYDKRGFLAAPFVRSLPDDVLRAIERFGIRNSHLLAIAPTGTISLLANNVSSGLEPIFADRYTRRTLDRAGHFRSYEVNDYAVQLWREKSRTETLPPAYCDINALEPEAHLLMQAALQPLVDSAISKTINVPENFPFQQFQEIYQRAFELGLKGVTVFRPNPITDSVLGGVGAQCQWCERDGEVD